MAHEAGGSLPVWLATRSRLVTSCTGAAATEAHFLDLHKSISYQVGHTTNSHLIKMECYVDIYFS